jgi:hypothetical protein
MEGDSPQVGKWHVPGKPSAVFECTEERFLQLQEQNAVAVLNPSDDDEDVPSDRADKNALPLDFPYRKHLVAAGLNTLDAVRSFPDLTQVPGVGEAYADRIIEALDELDEDEDKDE